eukprot:3075992-Alexandrium_andersonii.AAC.1
MLRADVHPPPLEATRAATKGVRLRVVNQTKVMRSMPCGTACRMEVKRSRRRPPPTRSRPVSYTHLTLPTICSV